MNPNEWLYLILGIVVVDYVIDQLLDFLNFKHSKTAVPYKLKDLYDEEEYARSQAYQKARSRFGFLTSAFSTLLTMVVLLFGGFGVLDEFLRAYIENPILLSLAFFGVLFILSDIVNTPFSLYSTFVIEERFGFNKTTVKTFVMDKLKGYLLTVIVGGILGYALLWIVHQLGDNFWLYALALVSAFMLIMNLFYTSLILPLFNKLKPLEDGALKEKIMTYASGVDFPLDNIFVIDGSKRSTKANAFFSGIGKKKKHIVLSLVLSILQMAVTFYVLSLFVFSDNLSVALGGSQMAIHLNFIAFGLLYTPISRLTGLAMNALSRKNEFEADAYAVTTYAGKPLMDALKKLSVSSLSNLTPHPAYVFAHYSHPPLLQRLEAMEELTKGS